MKKKYDLNNLKQYFKEGLYQAGKWIRFKEEKDFGLLLAIINDDLEAVKGFLKEGANPSAVEARTEATTVFQHATIHCNNPEIMKILLKHEMASEKNATSSKPNQGRVKLVVRDFNTALSYHNYETFKVLVENDKDNLFKRSMKEYLPKLITVSMGLYDCLNSIRMGMHPPRGETFDTVSEVIKQRKDLAYRHLAYWGCSALVTAGCFVGFGLAPAASVMAISMGAFAIANSLNAGVHELTTVVSTDAQIVIGKFTAMLHTQKNQIESTSKQM